MGKNLNEFFVPADNLTKLKEHCKTYREVGDLIGLSASGVRTMILENKAKLAYELAAGAILKQREEDELFFRKLEDELPTGDVDPLLDDQDVAPDVADPFDDYAGPLNAGPLQKEPGFEVDWDEVFRDTTQQEPPASKVPTLAVFTVYTNLDDAELLGRFARTMLDIPVSSMIVHEVDLTDL